MAKASNEGQDQQSAVEPMLSQYVFANNLVTRRGKIGAVWKVPYHLKTMSKGLDRVGARCHEKISLFPRMRLGI